MSARLATTVCIAIELGLSLVGSGSAMAESSQSGEPRCRPINFLVWSVSPKRIYHIVDIIDSNWQIMGDIFACSALDRGVLTIRAQNRITGESVRILRLNGAVNLDITSTSPRHVSIVSPNLAVIEEFHSDFADIHVQMLFENDNPDERALLSVGLRVQATPTSKLGLDGDFSSIIRGL